MTSNQMFVGRLVLVAGAITAVTVAAMTAWGGAPIDRSAHYVSRATSGDPVALGARLYETKGCAGCHSIDGSPRVGPSFKGTYGTQVALVDGAAVIDDAYLRESILSPRAKTRAGYQQVMPAFEGLLRDREIDVLVHYIKSLRQPSAH